MNFCDWENTIRIFKKQKKRKKEKKKELLLFLYFKNSEKGAAPFKKE